jgi:sugar phosphate isomerase/epimerase
MLPNYDLAGTCKLLQDNAYDGLELRVRYYTGDADAAPSCWGRHLTDVSPDNVLEKAPEIRATLADHGLAAASFASNCGAHELETVAKLAAGAEAIGCPRVRVGAPRGYNGSVNYWELYDEAVKAYEQVIGIFKPRGIKAVIEIHGGTIMVSASLAHRIVSNFDPADIGVIYDPQNMVADGFETTPLGLDLLGDYVAHLHVGGHSCVPGDRDETGSVKWSYPRCSMADGVYHYPTLIRELKKRGYDGFISLEDFSSEEPEADKVSEAITYLKAVEAAV